MGFEFELKFRATPDALDKIKKAYPGGQMITMQTTYYDDVDGSLSAKKYTLRKRQENDRCVCTLKTPAGKLGRGEFETMQETIEQAIPELCKLAGVSLPTELIEVCGAKFTRYAKELILDACTLEIAADTGVLIGGGKEQSFCEVEVELKAGSPAAVIAFAKTLAGQYDLTGEEKSKFKRALELAKNGRF